MNGRNGMSVLEHKKKSGYAVRIGRKGNATAYGGQLIVDAMCRRFRIWEKIAKSRKLGACTDKAFGFTPEALAAQVIFTFTRGGVSLSHLAGVQTDPVMLKAVGLARAADTDTVARWLGDQTPESVAELRAVNAALVEAVMAEADPARFHNSKNILRIVYEDHQIRSDTWEFEGMRLDARGFHVLTQYVLWAGPFQLELGLDGTEAVLGDKLELMRRYRHIWQDSVSHFFADTEGCSGEQMTEVRKGGFTTWSVRNPQWREQLIVPASRIPEQVWTGKIKRVAGVVESYVRFAHMLEGTTLPQIFAAARRRASGNGSPWQYNFLACEPGSARELEAVFAFHRTRGEGRHHKIPYLNELGLFHPPCRSLVANQAYYALGTIAWNIVMAVKVLEMPDAMQSWRMESIILNLLNVPAEHVKHANRNILTLGVKGSPEEQLWWETFVKNFVLRRKQGESIKEAWDRQKNNRRTIRPQTPERKQKEVGRRG
jgi:hypothetical protein